MTENTGTDTGAALLVWDEHVRSQGTPVSSSCRSGSAFCEVEGMCARVYRKNGTFWLSKNSKKRALPKLEKVPEILGRAKKPTRAEQTHRPPQKGDEHVPSDARPKTTPKRRDRLSGLIPYDKLKMGPIMFARPTMKAWRERDARPTAPA